MISYLNTRMNSIHHYQTVKDFAENIKYACNEDDYVIIDNPDDMKFLYYYNTNGHDLMFVFYDHDYFNKKYVSGINCKPGVYKLTGMNFNWRRNSDGKLGAYIRFSSVRSRVAYDENDIFEIMSVEHKLIKAHSEVSDVAHFGEVDD